MKYAIKALNLKQVDMPQPLIGEIQAIICVLVIFSSIRSEINIKSTIDIYRGCTRVANTGSILNNFLMFVRIEACTISYTLSIQLTYTNETESDKFFSLMKNTKKEFAGPNS